ncbi:hypothetical protein SERLA73DRAFT_79138 [Serpula lacrymans var. lacrymans S7.3]|uniref:Uncharacterized protein n=2 Tax=Serpula lacrymans var. lacrymans TaxID=341189 RepID=F8QFD6_SERL3|nr:uncharacterized protein SERLADRAFT_443112 [Serpula lacrymans var. lacrymans S7.9]EGN92920.1 hypothetical protein SERLA73DRAFT_79138 [Serpula lacrymans var. lacrymans S7.3]EGO19643.1 hypothetical protein SERLADRAFT_443112 [Serpula lacrymans var. lacrymans S7.9]
MHGDGSDPGSDTGEGSDLESEVNENAENEDVYKQKILAELTFASLTLNVDNMSQVLGLLELKEYEEYMDEIYAEETHAIHSTIKICSTIKVPNAAGHQ